MRQPRVSIRTRANVPDWTQYFNYWADANWDVRQRFSFSGTYTLPGLNSGPGRVLTSGWELTTIAAIQTGTPFWVINTSPSADYNNDGTYYDIPNRPGADFSGSHSRQAYINGIFLRRISPYPLRAAKETCPATSIAIPACCSSMPAF